MGGEGFQWDVLEDVQGCWGRFSAMDALLCLSPPPLPPPPPPPPPPDDLITRVVQVGGGGGGEEGVPVQILPRIPTLDSSSFNWDKKKSATDY